MKKLIVVCALLFSLSPIAHAATTECRWNTIDGKPIVRVWGFDGKRSTSSRAVAFADYAKRDEALKLCQHYNQNILIQHGTYEFATGPGYSSNNNLIVKGYALTNQHGTLLSHTLDKIAGEMIGALQLKAEAVMDAVLLNMAE